MGLFQTKVNDTLVAMGWETKTNDALGAMRWGHLWVLPVLVLLVAVMKLVTRTRRKNLYPKYTDIPSSIIRRIATKRELQELSGHVDYVIVGSGIGGLTCAAILSRLGYKVVVFEQHYTVGGSTHSYKTHAPHEFEFDVGVHYVGGKLDSWISSTRLLFNFLTDGRLEWSRLSENYDIAYNATTGERLEITGSKKVNRKVLLNHFPNLSAKALDKYYWTCFWVEKVSLLVFLLKLFPPFVTKMVWPLFGPLYRRVCMRTTLQVMRECGIPNDAIGAILYNWGKLGVK
jgi:all-trans-retinol 13,14-reductase